MEANVHPMYTLEFLKGYSDFEYDGVSLFYLLFHKIPSHWKVGDISEKLLEKWLANGEVKVVQNHQFNYYRSAAKSKRYCMSQAYVLSNEMILELKQDRLTLIYDHAQADEAERLARSLARCRKKKSHNDSIRLITTDISGYDTKSVHFTKPKINLDTQYNDDFLPVHEHILSFLKKCHTSGLILLHGHPGTGKSTYIRYLASLLTKRVLFLPATVAGQLDNPSLTQLLVKNTNSVFILEDAEELLVSRENQRNSGISMLLNLTDGFLGNCLGIQFIATFNTHIRNIDKALLRKGRLVARYEFGPLTPEKSTRLLQSINPTAPVSMQPMTLSEIYHPERAGDIEVEQKPGIGFLGRAV